MSVYIIYGLIGAISGLHSSCWGAYKDSLYEEFKIITFVRSIIVGFVLGILLFQLLKINGIYNINLGMFFVFVMTFERLFTESLKVFFREEKQDKYKIPSKFHIFGKIVENRVVRLVIGIILVSIALLSFYVPHFIKINLQSTILIGFILGVLAGLAGSAIGGSWKDAPIEGFNPLKFLRSPLVAGIWGMIFSFFTINYSFLLFACIGAERMTIEFYKTFITKKTPGKFKATKPIYKEWVRKRKKFILPYVATWAVFISLLII